MLPRRVARCLPWVALVAAAAIIAVGVAVRGRRTLGIDRWADKPLRHMGHGVHHLADGLRDLCNPVPFTFLLTATLVVWALRVGWGAAIAVGLGVGADLALIEWVLKPIVGRHAQFGDGNSYPSGHTGAAFGLATALVLLLGQPTVARHVSRVLRVLLGVVLYLVAAGVGVSMVITYAHYLSDVLASVPIGVIVPLLGAASYDRVLRRRSADGPADEPLPDQPVGSGLR
jgi:membrane-associated phospholipid phosphatase